MEDLADFRRQSLRERTVTRRTKAREAFQGPWLQSTERELHETTVKPLTAGVDNHAGASLEAYQLLLQEKLKQHQQNLGFNLDCTIALEKRKRAWNALGLLSKEHRDLPPCSRPYIQLMNLSSHRNWPARMQHHLLTMRRIATMRLTYSLHKCQPHLQQLSRSQTRLQCVCTQPLRRRREVPVVTWNIQERDPVILF